MGLSADKRSVHTDALETLGTIIGSGEARDAIHLGVEPVIAGTSLAVGAHVELRDGKAYAVAPHEGVGIVDPFLHDAVKKGQRFWLVVYPRKITSLRHVWEHPDFPASGQTERSEGATEKDLCMAWIRDYAARLSGEDDYWRSGEVVTAEELIEGAHRKLDSGDYMVRGAMFEGSYTSEEFWQHFEVVTGRKVPAEDRGNFFSCSC